MNSEPLNEAPVPQWRSSQAALTLLSPIVAGVATLLVTWIAYRILPADVAKEQLVPINASIAIAGGGASLTGAVGFVQRGLKLTTARIKGQEVSVMGNPITALQPLQALSVPGLALEREIVQVGTAPENQNIEVIDDAPDPPQGS